MGFPAFSRFGYFVSLGKIYQSGCTRIFDWHLAGAPADAGYCGYAGKTAVKIRRSYAACFYYCGIGIIWGSNAFPANDFADKRKSGWQMDYSLTDTDVRNSVLPCQLATGNGIGDCKAKAGTGRDIGA